jgi:uncharacterized protein (TIGR00369 family)
MASDAILALMTDAPSPAALRLDVAALNAFLARAFPASEPGQMPQVTHVEPGLARVSAPTSDRSLRPGGVISGPTMMSLADMAAYALILAHIGEVAMAVTTSLTIHFLRPCRPGALVAEARMLRLGRRIATCEISLWTEGPDKIAARATVAYALPDGNA